MTWHEANLSLTLASELRVGYLLNQQNREAKAAEDAAYAMLKQAVG
jgi:hypothetical protein